MSMPQVWIYYFGDGGADGDPERKDILGGKGASLAAMSRAGLPVPPGFTISTECCKLFLDADGRWPPGLEDEVRDNLARLERATGRTFGDVNDPLLVSVRSGAAVSMPGMMDTLLNCGLYPEMATHQADPAAFWRVYNQFVVMFGKTVADIPVKDFEDIEERLRSSRPDRQAPRLFQCAHRGAGLRGGAHAEQQRHHLLRIVARPAVQHRGRMDRAPGYHPHTRHGAVGEVQCELQAALDVHHSSPLYRTGV